jgi:hypothetical protein
VWNVSKHHRENNRKFADWVLTLSTTSGNVTSGFAQEQALVTGAVFTRDQYGGYTFTDKSGVTGDFAPGTVLHVMRRDPEPEAQPSADDAWPLGRPLDPADLEVLDSRA